MSRPPAAGLGRHPGLERRGDARRHRRLGPGAEPRRLGAASSSTTPRPTARARSPGARRGGAAHPADRAGDERRRGGGAQRRDPRRPRPADRLPRRRRPLVPGEARAPDRLHGGATATPFVFAGLPPGRRRRPAARDGARRRRGSTARRPLQGNVIGCLTAVYDRAAFGRVEMPTLRRRQDYGLWLRLLAAGAPTPTALPELLADYRVRPGLALGRQARRRRRRPGRSTARSRASAAPRAGCYLAQNLARAALKRAG